MTSLTVWFLAVARVPFAVRRLRGVGQMVVCEWVGGWSKEVESTDGSLFVARGVEPTIVPLIRWPLEPKYGTVSCPVRSTGLSHGTTSQGTYRRMKCSERFFRTLSETSLCPALKQRMLSVLFIFGGQPC